MHNSLIGYVKILREVCDAVGAEDLASYIELTDDDYIRFQVLFLDEWNSLDVGLKIEDLEKMKEEDIKSFILMSYHGKNCGMYSQELH